LSVSLKVFEQEVAKRKAKKKQIQAAGKAEKSSNFKTQQQLKGKNQISILRQLELSC